MRKNTSKVLNKSHFKNGCNSFFLLIVNSSVFKRGMTGIFHSIAVSGTFGMREKSDESKRLVKGGSKNPMAFSVFLCRNFV